MCVLANNAQNTFIKSLLPCYCSKGCHFVHMKCDSASGETHVDLCRYAQTRLHRYRYGSRLYRKALSQTVGGRDRLDQFVLTYPKTLFNYSTCCDFYKEFCVNICLLTLFARIKIYNIDPNSRNSFKESSFSITVINGDIDFDYGFNSFCKIDIYRF